jgi:hypothetical protein
MMKDGTRRVIGPAVSVSHHRLRVEIRIESAERNDMMATLEKPSNIAAEEMADMEEVCRLISEGKRVTNPALLRRISDRAEQVRREMFDKHGMTNIAVDLIREVRDEG